MSSEKHRVLGLRCGSTEYSFAVLKGGKRKPEVVVKGTVKFPKSNSRALNIAWFKQEIDDIFTHHAVSFLAIKGTEGLASRGAAFVARVEHEAAAILAAVNKGIRRVPRKVKSTIAKDLGLKGKGAYLATKLDTSVIPDFEKQPPNVKEAILVGWSELW